MNVPAISDQVAYSVSSEPTPQASFSKDHPTATHLIYYTKPEDAVDQATTATRPI